MILQEDFDFKNRCARTAPNAKHYFDILTPEYEVYISLSVVFCLLIIALFIGKLFVIFHYVSSYRRAGFMIWLCAVFPITAIVSTVSIIIPRAMAISNMFVFLYFARSLFTFVELVIDYFGGRIEMAKELEGNEVNMNIPPCCCCCPCLPTLKPSPQNLRRLGVYVYQTAVINPGIYFVAAVIWTDQIGLPTTTGRSAASLFLPVLSILSFASTMIAMYGINLYARMALGALKGYCVLTQVRFMQIMMLLFNLQNYIFTIMASYDLIKCDSILPANSKAALYDRFTLIIESCILSLASAWLLRPKVNATFDLHPARNISLHRKPAFSFSDPRPLHRVRGSTRAESISDALSHPLDVSFYYIQDSSEILADIKEQKAAKGPNHPVRRRSSSANYYTRKIAPAPQLSPMILHGPCGPPHLIVNSSPDKEEMKKQIRRRPVWDSILETEEEETDQIVDAKITSRHEDQVHKISACSDDVFETEEKEETSDRERKKATSDNMYLKPDSLNRFLR